MVHEPGGNADERWYWLVPMLLDFLEFPAAARAWWDRKDLASTWAGAESGEEDAVHHKYTCAGLTFFYRQIG